MRVIEFTHQAEHQAYFGKPFKGESVLFSQTQRNWCKASVKRETFSEKKRQIENWKRVSISDNC